MNPLPLYPLLTERRIMEPLWGGTRLAPWLSLPEPAPERIGETWQVFDSNPVLNGPLAGQTLAEVTQAYGAALVGTRTMQQYGADFPLLAKFIDAAQPLSIQVHPDDRYAHEHEAATGFHGKTEAWYILHADKGASVVYGLEQPTNRETFAAAVEAEQVEALLHRVPVQAGDVIFVPAGTIHAIDAGTMLFEIQQKSDLTYRVYDYGRRDARTGKPRELHLGKALDVSDLAPAPRETVPPLPFSKARSLLVACSLFALEGWTLSDAVAQQTNSGTFEIWTVIEGEGRLAWANEELPLRRGASVVLPAALGRYTIAPSAPELRLLRAYVPDLEQDLADPLRRQGVDEERLAQTIAF